MADGEGSTEAREPRQGRSKASYERMVKATLELLRECGGAGFTLAEVSRRGDVSIGSIYCRFENKDALVRDVHGRLMARYDEEQRVLLQRLRAQGLSLSALVPAFVEQYAEFLRKRAPMLAPLMNLAAEDAAIAKAGKRAYESLALNFRSMVLEHRDEIRHADPERAADSVFCIAYAALARHLGLGGAVTAMGQGDWKVLKEDLGAMALAFLQRRS